MSISIFERANAISMEKNLNKPIISCIKEHEIQIFEFSSLNQTSQKYYMGTRHSVYAGYWWVHPAKSHIVPKVQGNIELPDSAVISLVHAFKNQGLSQDLPVIVIIYRKGKQGVNAFRFRIINQSDAEKIRSLLADNKTKEAKEFIKNEYKFQF